MSDALGSKEQGLVQPGQGLEAVVAPSPEEVRKLLRSGTWASDWGVISKLPPEQIPKGPRGGVLRIEATVQAVCPDAPTFVRNVAADIIARQVREAGEDPASQNISLLGLAKRLEPVVESLTKVAEPAISPGDQARRSQLVILEQAARELGLDGAQALVSEVQSLRGVVRAVGEENEQLRGKIVEQAREFQAFLADPKAAMTRYEYHQVLKEGRILLLARGGEVTLQKKLGEGAYGQVWVGVLKDDSVLNGERVAVKIMEPNIPEEEKYRFRREEVVLMTLSRYMREHGLRVGFHNPVPMLIGGGGVKAARSEYEYFAMTYATGEPLDILLRENREPSQQESLTIVSQFCRVLEALHNGEGRSYLDFQAKNIFWDKEKDYITVVDFNVLTSLKDFDPQSDLLVASSLLCRLLTGKELPQDISPVLLQQSLEKRGVSSSVQSILKKGLSREVGERYATAEELRLALEEAQRSL